MKLMIDIPDITYKRTLEIGALQICTDNDIYQWIANGTPIPDNAINGDVIKSMFPNYKFKDSCGWVNIYIGGEYGESYSFCPDKFWNAPYKAEPKAELNGEMKAMLNSSFYNR